MNDLTEFLSARIEDDIADAEQLEKDLARWERETKLNGADGTQGSIVAAGLRGGAFDPARVLAECEAKRRIVEEHPEHNEWGHKCVETPCDTLKLLALPYADHLEYNEEWRPQP